MNRAARRNELLLPLIIVGGAVALLAAAPSATFPFILAVAAAYLLNPIVSFFESRGYRRVYVAAGLYLVAGIAFALLTYYLINLIIREVTLLQNQWPVYLEKFRAAYANSEAWLVQALPFSKDVYASWGALVGQKVAGLVSSLPTLILKLIPGATLLFLVPFISFFFLVGGKAMLDGFLDRLPSKYVETALHIICEVDESLGNYLRGIMVEAAILFALALVGLTLIGLEYAGAIAVIMGVSSLIPYVGTIVGVVLSAAAAFAQFYSMGPVVEVLLFFLFLRFIDDWFLQPFILERAVSVHPIVIVFSLLAGAELFGIWGVIFAMPVACVLKVFLNIAVELHRTEYAWKPKPEPTRISIPYI